MNTNINRVALVVLLLIAAALGTYWYASPYLAVRQMQSAARAGDADAFNDHVDYPRLRESLKGQLSALVADKLGRDAGSGNPLAALGNMLGLAMVDKMVDAMVRPEVVMLGMQNGRFLLGTPAPDGNAKPGETSPGNTAPALPTWAYVRKGADKLIAYPGSAAQPDDQGAALVFERSGFATWKLTEIRMPLGKL